MHMAHHYRLSVCKMVMLCNPKLCLRENKPFHGSWWAAGTALEEDGFTVLSKAVVKLDKHKCTEGWCFRSQGGFQEIHWMFPVLQFTQRDNLSKKEQSHWETDASSWSRASKGQQNDARQGTSNGWWRVAFRMGECAGFLKPCSVTSGLFPLLSKVSISAALLMSCHPEKEALQYSLISNTKCEMHCKVGGSACWICSTFQCALMCCHIPPVSWGRAGPCGKTGDPLAHSHPDPPSPPSLSTYHQIWGHDDFPLDLGEEYISSQAVGDVGGVAEGREKGSDVWSPLRRGWRTHRDWRI